MEQMVTELRRIRHSRRPQLVAYTALVSTFVVGLAALLATRL